MFSSLFGYKSVECTVCKTKFSIKKKTYDNQLICCSINCGYEAIKEKEKEKEKERENEIEKRKRRKKKKRN